MKKFSIVETVSNTFNYAIYSCKKHSPEILIVTGVVGVVVSAVMACKASTQLKGVMDESKEKLDDIHTKAEEATTEAAGEEEITACAKEERKELASAYAHTGIALAKLYGPSVVLGVVSITCILSSHNILKKRNLALAAAYKAVSASYKDYEERVKAQYGEEIAKKLKYGLTDTEAERTTTDENGKVKTEKEVVETVNPVGSPYAVFFDSTSRCWEDDPCYNKQFLISEQKWACEQLRIKKYLTLATVKDRLDIPVSEQDLVTGWIYDPQNPISNNFVDFGIFESHRKSTRRFVNGLEPVVLLDFNVDGYIFDRMKTLRKR